MTLVYGALVFAIAAALSWPLGRYMRWALAAPRPDSPDLIDRLLVRWLGPRVLDAQSWRRYALSLLALNGVMFAVVFPLLVCQGWLPLNPDGKPGLDPSLAFHTAMSFVTNTNLQHYAGEQSLSYLSQLGLTWLQFTSATTGIAALAALARCLGDDGQPGCFVRDAARATLLVLLPLAVAVAIVLLLAGVPMTFEGSALARTVEGGVQAIARGPVAAMVAIKQIGTNGGGYFGPNSTHPFENPSFLTAAVEHVAIFLVPMTCVWMFGRINGQLRHAAVLFAVMTGLLVAMAIPAAVVEQEPNAAFAALPVDQSLGNLEGKELRFGTASGPMWAVSTTATSNGSVSAMHDSLNPLTGLAPLIGMWTNVAFGGVGVGSINMFLYIVVAVFLAGLMVGRTPEYLGKKIEAGEMKLAALALLLHPFLILGGTALFAATAWGAATVSNPGSHGFTQILYEMSSAAANNGSGFEGLADDTTAWNVATAIIIGLGRYLPIVLPLAIAGSLAGKRAVPRTTGTFRTDTPLFGLLLLGSVLLLGALLFLPAAVLGPIADHLALTGR